MALRSVMILMTLVSFANAASPGLARLTFRVPQFFSVNGDAYQVENSYLLFKARRMREKSITTTAEHIKEFLQWRVNNKLEIEDVSDDDFEYFIDALCAYKNHKGKGLSWNTVNGRVSGAYRFLIWCKTKNINSNLNLECSAKLHNEVYPRFKVKKHPMQKLREPTKFLIMEDAIKFVRALGEISASSARNKERNLLMAKLMLQCGVRVSEATNFPVCDLPDINHGGDSTPARIIGKGGKARFILIPNGLLSDLWAYNDVSRERILDNLSKSKSGFECRNLFISERAKSISINWVEKIFYKVGREVGLEVVPHILRHTFGSYHYLLNKDLVFLSQLMGHESERTTEKHYVHIAKLISYSGEYEELQRKLDAECREI
jgi:integrase/recombinase XerD